MATLTLTLLCSFPQRMQVFRQLYLERVPLEISCTSFASNVRRLLYVYLHKYVTHIINREVQTPLETKS